MRRHLQFRLRTLFVLTMLVAVACVVLPAVAERYRAYREEQKCDALIEALRAEGESRKSRWLLAIPPAP